MRKILLLASDSAEIHSFDDSFIKVITGVGKTRAAIITAKAIEKFKPDLVVNVGSVGAVNTRLEIGSVVTVRNVVNMDADLTMYHLPLGTLLDEKRTSYGLLDLKNDSSITLGTSETFSSIVTDKMIKLNVDITDMEGYGIALACSSYDIPIVMVKVVTDMVGQNIKLSDYKKVLKEVRSNLKNRVLEII